MDVSELYRKWNQNKDRPAFVMEHADEINDHVETDERVPVKSIYQVRQWLSRYKGTVTRQLAKQAGEAVDGDTDTSEAGK